TQELDPMLTTPPASSTPPPPSVQLDTPAKPTPAFPFHGVRHHRPGWRPRGRRLATFVVLGLNALALSLLGWGLFNRLSEAKTPEKSLLSAKSSPKLMATSAMAPSVTEQAAPTAKQTPTLEEKTLPVPPPVMPPEPEPQLTIPALEPPPLVPVPE